MTTIERTGIATIGPNMRCWLTGVLTLLAAVAAIAQEPPEQRGFKGARLILQEPNVSFYLVMIPGTTPNIPDPAVVAIHQAASETDPFAGLDPQRVTINENGQQYSGWRYSAAMIEHFERAVFPAIVRAQPDYSAMNSVSVMHYAAGFRREDTPFFKSRRQYKTPNVEYEQPMFASHWTRSGGKWNPFYTARGIAGHASGEDFATIAEARKAGALTGGGGAAVPATVARRSDLLKEREDHSRLQTAKAIEVERKRRRPGIVYKSEQYWQQHPNFASGRAVFDGKGHLLSSSLQGMADFQETALAYLTGYYDFCYEEDLKFRRDVKGYRYKIGEDSKYSPIVMDERFAPYFEQYMNAHRARVGLGVIQYFSSALDRSKTDPNALFTSMLDMVAGKLAAAAGWKMFFSKARCRSATMKQMTENMLLAARNQGSLQTAGISVPGADRESDPVTAADVNIRPRGIDLARLVASIDVKNPPIAFEELDPFRRIHFVDTSQFYKEPQMADLIAKLDEDGPAVIRCHYGPVGAYRNGDPKYAIYTFWYRAVPADAKAAVALDKNKRMNPGLQFALTGCPATRTAAEAMALGK